MYSIGDVYEVNGQKVGIVYEVSADGTQAKVINVKQATYRAMYTWAQADSVAASAGDKWYLPSVDEMGAIYKALDVINAKLTELKNDDTEVSLNAIQVWTSEEDTDGFAFAYNMNGGYVEGVVQSSKAVVIAIRHISIDNN